MSTVYEPWVARRSTPSFTALPKRPSSCGVISHVVTNAAARTDRGLREIQSRIASPSMNGPRMSTPEPRPAIGRVTLSSASAHGPGSFFMNAIPRDARNEARRKDCRRDYFGHAGSLRPHRTRARKAIDIGVRRLPSRSRSEWAGLFGPADSADRATPPTSRLNTHRVAISNRRLVAADAMDITFKYKDYRIEGPERYKLMTLLRVD